MKSVQIPPLGESVVEATLLRWKVKDGESVKADMPLCELETDKANVDLPAPATGTLTRLKKEGDVVKIGEVIAQIQEGAFTGVTPAKSQEVKETPKPAAAPPVAIKTAAPSTANKSMLQDLRPSLRKKVEENKIDLSFSAKMPTSTPSTQTVVRTPMSKLRKRIAERLVASKQESAMLTTFNEVDLTEVIAMRQKYKERFEKKHGVSLGFMSLFAKAVTQALLEFPVVNSSIEGEEIIEHRYVNLGVAVSTERGLVVPVLRNAEQMSVAKIESEIKRMALSARDGKLSLEELGGGTFTITNGGVFGSLLSTPILTLPQSAILGMHTIQKRPMVMKDGSIEARDMMYLAVSYDHRIIDGRDAVSFLVRIKEMLEDPARLVLEI